MITQSLEGHLPTADECCWFARNACSRPVRSLVDFAQDELILPYDGGPHEGESFKFEFQPFTRLLLEEIDKQRWAEYYITGPSQSGKTLICFVLLIAYSVAELRRNIVVGVPDKDMANDKWKIDIAPVFKASPRLSRLLPTSGPGSKGGAVKDSVTLTNGVVIKMMAPGGDDSNKAGFTAKTVVVTEAARFSDPGQTSVEADPLRQLVARQRATSQYDADGNLKTDRQLFVEGTVTLEDELPWQAFENSSQSQIACPCVHCGAKVTLEREHFTGWEGAATEAEAAKSGAFYCYECGEKITEHERREMNNDAELVHSCDEGQRRLFFRWSAFNNLFTTSGDLAADLWRAAQLDDDAPDRINAEKDLSQSVWCKPYQPALIDSIPLKPADVLNRGAKDLPYGLLPADLGRVTVGVDLGRWECWFFVLCSHGNGELYSPAFGSIKTDLDPQSKINKEHELTAIYEALAKIGEILDRGWAAIGENAGGAIVTPDLVLIDEGYLPEVAYAYCASRGSGPNNIYQPCDGVGKSQFSNRKYLRPTSTNERIRKIEEGWHREYVRSRKGWKLTLDADAAKIGLQKCLRVERGNPGALTIAKSDNSSQQRKLARHLASEVRIQVLDPVKGLVEEWRKVGANHWLDCAAYAYTAQRVLGWTVEREISSAADVTKKGDQWRNKLRAV